MVNDDKSDKNLFSVVGTMMNTFTKSKSIPVKKCSVSSLYLDDINEHVRDENDDVNSLKSKENRLIWSKCMFLKEFFALRFIGFDQVATYPLKEEYSKWMLIIFKPWKDDPGALKVDGAFSNALELYMWNENIPRRICLEILRRKLRFVTDHSEGILCKIDLAQTPTEEEQHFEELNGGDDEIDWFEHYDEKYESWLEKFSLLIIKMR
eukprot:11834800-Ditylum_brightwellii.AAC.1